ncbi:MAG: NAD(P)-dependent oxidoreductase [Alphaproteobacteria bacterium]|nr:MAG: NAD(P)-dependent oxidoreductase [Alphaproteobacteria bacterium]
MIIVDSALRRRAEEGRPVRVGMIGAGFMGRGIASQILNHVPGMALVAIANRNIAGARRAYAEAGADDAVEVSTQSALEDAIRAGRRAVTEDAMLLARAENVDVLIEVTGAIEFGARVVTEAIAHGNHVVLMNAELDGTVGPILKVMADRAGVILSGCDGDQPGVQMNLIRFVRGMGLTPLVAGNIKGLQDPYRTPTTQKAFAERWGQKPHMVTSFADGTKISFEQAIVANAAGFRVPRRGMIGADHRGHVDELVTAYDIDMLKSMGGIVDYVVGARPGPGVFVLATTEDPGQRHYLNLYKLGEGPLYCFYTPYHLCHFEVPVSAARVALFGDCVMAPLGAPRVEVIARAKTDLRAGEILDGIGWYMTYGEAENADVAAREGLLPMGVAEGCRLKRDIPRDTPLTYADVELPPGRLIDRLRAEQAARFPAGGDV